MSRETEKKEKRTFSIEEVQIVDDLQAIESSDTCHVTSLKMQNALTMTDIINTFCTPSRETRLANPYVLYPKP